MKAFILILMIFIGVTTMNNSLGAGDNKVVFENSSKSSEDWTALLNNVENVRNAFDKKIEIEVVTHGQGLQLLMTKDQELVQRMKGLADDKVHFMACENTMKKLKVKKEDLLPFSESVDSGVAELVRKQQQGWSYIKSGQ